MRTKRNTALLVILLAAFWSGTGIASAHFLTEDSVDGNEIRYEDNTKYNGALDNAIEKWEALPGGVSIAPDSFSTVADLEVKDYDDNDGSCGYWDGRSGADLINMNKFYNGGLLNH